MKKEVVFAGIGGQGALTAGNVLAYAGAAKDLDVTWIPSYGSEMRGGAANCTVKLGDEEVKSPFPKHPDVLVALSESAIAEFGEKVKKGGTIVVNTTVVHNVPEYDGVKVVKLPANDIADKLGQPRGANLCALGAALHAMEGLITLEEAEVGLKSFFKKVADNSGNISALRAGYEATKQA